MEKTQQIPIWFFIGALLAVYGLIILGTGLFRLFHPSELQMALGYLHADIWWGALLATIGTFYTVKYWPQKKTD
jgi:hypothetical protein